MKAPPESITAAPLEAAECDAKTFGNCHTFAQIVKTARERSQFYFARYERTGRFADILHAVAFQTVLVACLEARKP